MLKRSVLFIGAILLCIIVNAQTFDYPIETVNGQKVYLYSVAKSEGLYRISKRFGVSQEEIVKLNPELQSEGLKLGQTIKIPVIQTAGNKPVDTTAYITHILEPKETLYGISRKYDVSIENLIKINPETSKKMTIGSKLLIPKKCTAAPVKANFDSIKTKKTATDTVLVSQNVPAITPNIIAEALTGKGYSLPADSFSNQLPVRIAFLLPMMLDAPKREPSMDRFLEFYEGALLAINKLKNSGIKMEIYTYDIEKNNIKLQSVLAKPELRMMDVIIGPAYQSQVPYVSEFSLANRIYTLIPFTSKVPDTEINPYLLQFNPSPEQEASLIAHYLLRYKENIHCIFVDASAMDNSAESMHYMCDSLQNNGISCNQITTGAIFADSLSYFLQKKKRNLIVCNTKNYRTIKQLFPAISALSGKYNLEILGQYAWLNQTAEIPVPMLFTSLFHTQAPPAETIAYSKDFAHFYGHELSTILPRFDMLGYDLTTYLISAVSQFKTGNFSEQLENYLYDGIQSSIHFTHEKKTGGFINRNMYILRYVDGKTSVVFAPDTATHKK